MSAPATFEHFERELNRLVEHFGKHVAEFKRAGYDEANLRKDFLDPLFDALVYVLYGLTSEEVQLVEGGR